MRTILATDIGGTKTLFQLSTEQGDVLAEQQYDSSQFVSFDLVLGKFLNQDSIRHYSIASACFAVAGPVSGRNASVTNLPWQLNADDLARDFSIAKVTLCNDFAAVAYGISCLDEDDIICLQEGEFDSTAPRAVLGAGTGLGQALLLPQGDGWHVVATEGGHVDFAPTDRMQVLLLEHMRDRFGHVSYERLLSGAGLVAIYDFLRAYEQYQEDPDLRQAMINGDAAAAISQFGLEMRDQLASDALDLFIKIYGAQAGNLALMVLPMAGLYIAGAIAVKNKAKFQQDTFINAFLAKGKMSELMTKIPIRLILQTKVGLLGARLLAGESTV